MKDIFQRLLQLLKGNISLIVLLLESYTLGRIIVIVIIVCYLLLEKFKDSYFIQNILSLFFQGSSV